MHKLLCFITLSFLLQGCGVTEFAEKLGFFKSRNEIFTDDLSNKAAKAVERANTLTLDELIEQGLDANVTGLHGYSLLYWHSAQVSLRASKSYCSWAQTLMLYLKQESPSLI
jgi:hypothetical protein